MAPEVIAEFIADTFGEFSRFGVAFAVGFSIVVILVIGMVKLFNR